MIHRPHRAPRTVGALRRILALFVLTIGTVLGGGGCGASGGADSLEVARRFEEAEAVFAQATTPDEYLRAASLYGHVLGEGAVSGAILYNQGNAYIKAGLLGRAIAAYRQAQRYRPRDPYLDANLRYALLKANVAPEESRLVDHLLFWNDWLSYREKLALTTSSCGVVVLLALLALLLPAQRTWLRRFDRVFIALTLLAAASAAWDWYRFDHIQRGVVIQDDVVARKGNAQSYEPAFTEPLTQATEFRLLERRPGWMLIRLPNGLEGWIEESAATVY